MNLQAAWWQELPAGMAGCSVLYPSSYATPRVPDEGFPASVFLRASRAVPEGWDWSRLFPGLRRMDMADGDKAWPVFVAAGDVALCSDLLVRFMRARRCGERYWEPVPDGLGARVVVVAVRAGVPLLWNEPWRWEGTYRPEEPGESARHRLGQMPGWVARLKSALWGPDIIDLVALPLSLKGEPLLMTGYARCLGECPEDRPHEADEAPTRVHGSVPSWLASGCEGIVPLGDAASQQALLRDLVGGIVADSVAHGEVLARLMKRDLPAAPKVYVQQREVA